MLLKIAVYLIMLTSLITSLFAALVLYVIFYIVGKFIQGTPLQIIGIILGLILLVFALREFGFGGRLVG